MDSSLRSRALTLVAFVIVAVAGCSMTRAGRPASSEPSTSAPHQQSAPAEGLVRSGASGTGKFTTANLSISPSDKGRRVHRYAVRVEQGINIDANQAAREIQKILDDPRGWRGTQSKPTAGSRFQLVSDPARANLVIHISSPTTTDQRCAPMTTEGTWSCRKGKDVNFNSDRWLYKTPTYSDLHEYRAYMVNHEVGHYLGLNHFKCGGEGQLAPVMLQQSISLDGCRPNAWPTQSGRG